MSPVIFGQEPPPTGKGPRMVYVGRNALCGHIREVLADRSPADAEIAAGWALDGLVVERLPATAVGSTHEVCGVCLPPDQPAFVL